jgi:hypothetical protein
MTTEAPWWQDSPDGYEVLAEMTSGFEEDRARLTASYTPNNGIRIGIINDDTNPHAWAEYDFSREEAERLGNALLRWAARR